MSTLSFGLIEENLVFGEGDVVTVESNDEYGGLIITSEEYPRNDPGFIVIQDGIGNGVVTIADGYKVTFEAGSQLIMEGNSYLSILGSLEFEAGSQLITEAENNYLVDYGTLSFTGTEDNLFEINGVSVSGYEGSELSLDYVHTDGVRLFQGIQEENSLNLTNSVIEKPESRLFINSTAVISNNIFVDTRLTIDSDTQLTFVGNTFIGYSELEVDSWPNDDLSESPIILQDNNFLSDNPSFFNIGHFPTINEPDIRLSGNYWGTDDADDIHIGGPEELTNSVDLSNISSTINEDAALEIGKYYIDLDYMELVPSETKFTEDFGKLWNSAINVGDGSFIDAEEVQVYRSYIGLLDRLPKQDGFNWWVSEIQAGRQDLQSMTTAFMNTNEFISVADTGGDGVVTNNELINHIYSNMFERDADESGADWWLEQLFLGNKSQADVVTEMVHSDEYAELTLITVSSYEFLG